MSYFLCPGLGYISFVELGNRTGSPFVLSDPVCDPRHVRKLYGEFLREYPNPIIGHISRHPAEVLNSLGFYVNELGCETVIDLQEFDLKGSKKQNLRSARNGGKRDGLSILELSARDLNLDEVRAVSASWMEKKLVNWTELKLLTRPAVFEDEVDVRKFYAMKDGKAVGFVVFDPMYENGAVKGYFANIVRSAYTTSYGITDCIMLEAIDVFRSEGLSELSLGLAPMYNIDDQGEFVHSRPVRSLGRYLFEHGNLLFNFKQLAFHKRRYRSDLPGVREVKVYSAARNTFSFIAGLYKVLKSMGFNPLRQTVGYAQNSIGQKLRNVVQSTDP